MYSPVIQYKLSDTCGLECDACKLWQREIQEDFLPLSEVIQDLKVLKSRGQFFINFIGGDPLLHPECIEIVSEAKKMGFKIALTTPGFHILSTQRALQGLVDILIFVLHSFDPIEHDRITGISSHQNITDAIIFAKENRQRVMISFPVTRDTVISIPEMYEFCSNLKCLLWLNPVTAAYGLNSFEADSVAYMKYYASKKNVIINRAALWALVNKSAMLRERENCLGSDDLITTVFQRINWSTVLGYYSFLEFLWKVLRYN